MTRTTTATVIQKYLGQMDKLEERTVIVADGVYSGTENIQLATDRNVKLITTNLTGKVALDILGDFEFNEQKSSTCTEKLHIYETK